MRVGDSIKIPFKNFRDHTPQTKCDTKNVRQGFQIDEQDRNTGRYTLTNGGDENGWGFWDFGFVENLPIVPKANSRETNLSNFMQDNTISQNPNSREQGTYFQAAPVVMKPGGVYAIKSGGEIENQLKAKEKKTKSLR